MNSQPGYASVTTVRAGNPKFPGRAVALFVILMTAASLLSGCARIKQYSLDSWQGTLPMHDLKYVSGDQ
jgi:hypothetical protein